MMTGQTKIRNTNKAMKLMKKSGIARIVGSGIKVKIWNVRNVAQREGMLEQGKRIEMVQRRRIKKRNDYYFTRRKLIYR